MANQPGTRIWGGSVLSVRNDDDTDWVSFAKCIDHSMPGVAASQLDASTAESTVDEFSLGLPDNGQAVYNVFDDMDDTFLTAIDTMQTGAETRNFKLVMPEGEATTRYFNGYVVDAPINDQYNNLCKMTLTLKVNDDYWYQIPISVPTLSSSAWSAAGGTTITATGTGFVQDLTTVTVGATQVIATVVSATSLTFVTPAHAAGSVSVIFSNYGDSITKTVTYS